MAKTNAKQRLRARRRRERLRSTFLWVAAGIAVIAVLAALVWSSIRPPGGEAVPVMASVQHVAEGQDPGPFNTDPPTSGPHYASPLKAGFYDEPMVADLGPYPEGYLLHNLEHGYVILWYNCQLLTQTECGQLKEQLQEVIEDARSIKVIAFPWPILEVPVVATSWGRMMTFDEFSPRQALAFVRSNRNKAPEPQAQ